MQKNLEQSNSRYLVYYFWQLLVVDIEWLMSLHSGCVVIANLYVLVVDFVDCDAYNNNNNNNNNDYSLCHTV